MQISFDSSNWAVFFITFSHSLLNLYQIHTLGIVLGMQMKMTTLDKLPDHTSWPPGLHSHSPATVSHPTTSQSDLSKPQNTSYHSPTLNLLKGFPNSSAGKESACDAGDTGDVGSIPGSGRSSGEGHGNLLQYSCLKKPHGQRSWEGYIQRVTKSQAWLNDWTHITYTHTCSKTETWMNPKAFHPALLFPFCNALSSETSHLAPSNTRGSPWLSDFPCLFLILAPDVHMFLQVSFRDQLRCHLRDAFPD